MKLPDLHDVDAAGVQEHHASAEAIASASAAAKLRYFAVDLGKADSKLTLLGALAQGMSLPPHFGSNWDALADCLEDDDVIGKHGAVVRLAHSAAYRKGHATDWQTFTEILDEAAEFWKERHVPFWVFVA
jgi:barstar (barnase inhibitor)